MGRSYWYECGRCGYRAKVSGRADRGVNFWVQTVLCRDCSALHDAVIRLRVPDESPVSAWRNATGLRRSGLTATTRKYTSPPTFQAVLNQLPPKGVKRYKWLHFKPHCPVSPLHKVKNWNEPDQCPKCGLLMEKAALPYRIWD